MSSFFICSIACTVRPAFSGSGSLMYSPSCLGTICHETPYLSLSQPHCCASGSPPSPRSCPSSGRPLPASRSPRRTRPPGLNVYCGPPLSAVKRWPASVNSTTSGEPSGWRLMLPMARVLEDGDVEPGRVLGLAVEPEHGRDLLELGGHGSLLASGAARVRAGAPAGAPGCVVPEFFHGAPARQRARRVRASRCRSAVGRRARPGATARPAAAAAPTSPLARARSSSSTGTRTTSPSARAATKHDLAHDAAGGRLDGERVGGALRLVALAQHLRLGGAVGLVVDDDPLVAVAVEQVDGAADDDAVDERADGELAVDGAGTGGRGRPHRRRAPAGAGQRRRPRRPGPGARARRRRPRRPRATDASSPRSHSSMMRWTAEPSASALARPAGAPGPPARTASSTCSRPLGLVAGAGARARARAAPRAAPASRAARRRGRARPARRPARRAPAGTRAGSTSRPPSSYSSAIGAGAGSASAIGPSSTADGVPSLLRSVPKQRDDQPVAGARGGHVQEPAAPRSPP